LTCPSPRAEQSRWALLAAGCFPSSVRDDWWENAFDEGGPGIEGQNEASQNLARRSER